MVTPPGLYWLSDRLSVGYDSAHIADGLAVPAPQVDVGPAVRENLESVDKKVLAVVG